jgi:hypothetical protein
VMLDYKEAVAEALRGRQIHGAPIVRGHIHEGSRGFAQANVLRCVALALLNKHETQEGFLHS